jgi:type II secretory pathway predicted ATPase ExeA
MMLLQHFQFREQPFGATPDPRFLYYSGTHHEALASLYCAFYENHGFTALIAPPGMGKTTLLFQFLDYIRESARTVFLFDTQCESQDLIRYILRDLGITPASDVVEMHHQLNEVLLIEARAGRRFVLVIDEAQNLSDAALEKVRLLTNFETPRAKLMQIVLAGQPQLSEKLMSSLLVQLRQRISTICHLEPFSPAETAAYIDHRLQIAGYSGGALFTPQALQLIAEAGGGIPRVINCLCFNALSICCALKCKQVNHDMVAEVIDDLRLDSRSQGSLALDEKHDQRIEEAPPVILRQPKVGWFGKLSIPAVAALLFVVGLGVLGMSWSRAGHEPQPGSRNVQLVARTDMASAQTAGNNKQADTSVEITVEPHQTLRKIAVRYLGGFNEQSLQQIRTLNPDLTDPNVIQPGQKIRIPEQPSSRTKDGLRAATKRGVQ